MVANLNFNHWLAEAYYSQPGWVPSSPGGLWSLMAEAVENQAANLSLSTGAENPFSNDYEKKANDNRSFEERLGALIKPAVVDEPNEEKVQADLAILKEKIAQCDRRLVNSNILMMLLFFVCVLGL